MAASTMTFQFLDVGMGDGTLIQLCPAGQNYDTLVLVDFGEAKSQFKSGIKDALTYLRNTIAENSHKRGANSPMVDTLFITHPDADHFNKLAELLEPQFPGYQGELHFDKVVYGGRREDYNGFIEKLKDHYDEMIEPGSAYHAKIEGNTVKPDYEWGDIKAYILSANYPNIGYGEKNPKSIVLMFDLRGQKVILQGDAEAETEKWILSKFGHIQGFLEVVGHKLGHHGSNAATCSKWVEALKPKAIFASGDFVWRHPYCEPICRVLAGGTLAADNDHWYCCGSPGKDGEYYNNRRPLAVCMNLWYFVKSVPGEWLARAGHVTWCPTGVTIGVQWALQIAAGKTPKLYRTDADVPVDPHNIPPGWNCVGAVPLDLTRPQPTAADGLVTGATTSASIG